MATLNTLPAELKILVLKALPEFFDLNALVHASPTYHAVYLTQRPQILFDVLCNTYGGPEGMHCAYLLLGARAAALGKGKKAADPYDEWYRYPNSTPHPRLPASMSFSNLYAPERWVMDSSLFLSERLCHTKPLPAWGPLAVAEWAEIRKMVKQGRQEVVNDLVEILRLKSDLLKPESPPIGGEGVPGWAKSKMLCALREELIYFNLFRTFPNRVGVS